MGGEEGVAKQGGVAKQFALQGRKEALHHGVVLAITDRAHRGANARSPAALLKGDRWVLAAVVGMVKDAGHRTAMRQRHIERRKDEFGAQVAGHGPAHEARRAGVEQASSTTARNRKPCRVGTYVRSATHT